MPRMTWSSTPTGTRARTWTLLLASVVLASSGCDPSADAGRVRTTFDVAVHGDGPGQGLTTNGGDVVSLQRAEMSLGGL